MPLFEYRCAECGSTFEAIVLSQSKVSCPHCESEELERLHSTFAVSSGSRSSSRATSWSTGGG